MATTFKQPGDVMTFTAPTGGVTVGVPKFIGEVFVVPAVTAAATVRFSGMVTGVHKLTKVSAQAWTEGQPIFWDSANSRADSTVGVGPMIGHAAAVAANPTATGDVRLSGPMGGTSGQVGQIEEATPAHTVINTAGNVTLTIAQLLTQMIARDPNGGARTDTLPTAALMVAGIPGAEVGDKIHVDYLNQADAAEAITIAAGAGGTLINIAAGATIAQNLARRIVVRLTNVTASSEAYDVWLV